MTKNDGIYGLCDACDMPVYTHMEENMKIMELTGLCGVCATGEAATYMDEL